MSFSILNCVRRAMPLALFSVTILSLATDLFAQAVYVPNYTTSNIAAYLVDPSSGLLSAVAGSPVTTGTSPIQALVHPSGKFLYVLNAGSGDISLYLITAPSGALTFIPCPLCAAESPSGMAIDPAGQLLFVTNYGPGTVTSYRINSATGTLSAGVPASTGAGSNPVQPTVDPTGRYLYVADSGNGKVSGFVINGGFLTAVPGSPFAAGSGPQSVAASRTEVFVANQYSGDVSAYQIGSGGTLMQLGAPVPAGGSPTSIAVDSSGSYVYVANQVQLLVFSTIPDCIYALTQARAYSAGIAPSAVELDPSGNFVYAASFSSNEISGFAITGVGTLIPFGKFGTFGAIGPKPFAVHYIGDSMAFSITTPNPVRAGRARYGTPVEFKGSVSNLLDPEATPRGSVTFTVNGSPVVDGQVALDDSGGFDFIFHAPTRYLPVGSSVIRIAYYPAAGFEPAAPFTIAYTVTGAASNSAIASSPENPAATVAAVGNRETTIPPNAEICTVPRHPTVTTVNASSTSLVYGQAPTLTATVNAGGNLATGTVTFYDGTTLLGTVNITQSGGFYIAQMSTFKFVTLGQHVIMGVYSGDANNVASNSNATALFLTVGQDTVNVSTPVVTGAQTYGQPLTFAATVTAAFPGSGTPSGTMTFKDGGTTLGTAGMANGTASFTISTLTAGPHTITASYGGDTNFKAGNSAGGVQVAIAPASTAISVAATPASPVVYGQQVTLTATLAGLTNATGTVDFSAGGTKIGSGPVGGNKAVFSYTPATVGSHSITATYNGDANNGSISSSTTLVVNQASVNVSTPSISGTPLAGQPVTVTAAVTAAAPGSGVPGGAVTFKDGTTTLGTVDLGAGSATFTIPPLGPGSHSIAATYNGDANFTAGTSAPAALTTSKNTPTVALGTDVASPVYGQTVALTSTLGGNAGIPYTGTMDFFSNGTKLNPAPIAVSGGQAQFAYAVATTGLHAITALYSGDASYNTAGNNASPLSMRVNQAGVNVSTPSVSGTPAAGQSVNVTVSAAAPGSGTPSGAVTFKDGTAPLGTAELAAGIASLTVGSMAQGLHSITASYGGDTNFTAGTSAAVSVSTAKLTTAVALSADTGSPVAGQRVMLTATLGCSATTPCTGTMDFFDNGMKLNSAPVAVSGGQAQVAYIVGGAGLHAITALYSGDANYNTANNSASPFSMRVNQALATVSAPTLSGATTFGQPVTFTVMAATVAPGTGTPTGTVLFRDGTTLLGGAVLSGGSASLTTSALRAGTHSIQATYNGDANCAGASSTALTFLEDKAATNTSVSVSQTNTSTLLRATVSSASAGTPTGTMRFLNGAAVLANVPLTFGNASLELGETVGLITANYSGDDDYYGSGAARNLEAISKPAAGVTLKITPNPATVGQAVTFTINLAWNGGPAPTGKIQLYDGTVLLGSAAPGQQVNFTMALNNAGNHNMIASFTGDGTYASSSTNAGLVVNRNPGVALGLASDVAAPAFGQAVTLAAKLDTPAGGAAAFPTGQVQFREQNTVIGNAPLINGVATLAVSSLSPGIHQIIALYGGDAAWSSMTSNAVAVTVAKASTVVAISANPGDPGSDQAKVTATVAVELPGGGVPAGTVQFLAAATGQVLGSATLAGGSATLSVLMSENPGAIVALYDGDTTFGGSSSAPMKNFSILNSASNRSTVLTPDEMATVFSPDLAGVTAPASLPLPDVLGGVTLTLIDRAARSHQAHLLYVSPAQLNFLVPGDTEIGPATLKIVTARGAVITAAVNIGPVSPGLFAANARGEGVAAAQVILVHEDGSQQSPQSTAAFDPETQTWSAVPIDVSSPADELYLVLYGTGIRRHGSPATVTIGGQPCAVVYAGVQPTYDGLDQVNVLLPKSLQGAGAVDVTVTADGRQSNAVTLYFQ